MFENWKKPKHSYWILVIADEYLIGRHATSKYERAFTFGNTFDHLNFLEWRDRMDPSPFRKGCIIDFENAERCIVQCLNRDGLDKCAKGTMTVIFPKAINPEHLTFIADILKKQGFKEVNIYNLEIEITLPDRRLMPEDERIAFIEKLRNADLVNDRHLVWDDISFELLAKEKLHYSEYGCMYCGCDIVEMNYDMNDILPHTYGRGTIYICSNCMKLQRHKPRGTYMSEKATRK